MFERAKEESVSVLAHNSCWGLLCRQGRKEGIKAGLVPFTCVQGRTIRLFPGLVNFVPAVAYHFCLNLPAAFLQPGNGLLDKPCMLI